MIPIVKINGSSDILSGVRCRPNDVHISWSFSDYASINFEFLKFDLRISGSSDNHGTDSFEGDRFSMSNFSASVGSYIFSPSLPLGRNLQYFGQIKFYDNNSSSNWVSFILKVNHTPFVIDAKYLNSTFSIDNDLVIDFQKSREEISVEISWFRNNVLQTNLKNSKIVPSSRISYNDIWYAQILAFDDLETGIAVSLPAVQIKAETPVVSYLQILPPDPVEEDILEASYSLIEELSSGSFGDVIFNDASEIKWYVNEELIETANNRKFVRLNLRQDDVVYFTVRPENFSNFGPVVRSESKIIQSSGYFVFDMSIDGKFSNPVVSSDQPVIRWRLKKPGNKNPNFFKIIIGTRDGSNDVLSFMGKYENDYYTIPAQALKPGARYFVSISVSYDDKNFRNFGKINFYFSGKFWKENVSNEVGYTLLLKSKIHNVGSGEPSQLAGYSMQFSDGVFYYEVIEYLNKTLVIFDTSSKIEFTNNNAQYHETLIGVIGNRFFLFVNGVKKMDSTYLVSSSTQKFITLRSRPDGEKEVALEVEKLNINVDGIFEPGVSSIYAAQSFEERAFFPEGFISSMAAKDNHFIVSVNSFNFKESSKLYKFTPDQNFIDFNLNSTQNQYSNLSVDNFTFNGMELSPNGKKLSIYHSRGISIFNDLPVFGWDINTPCSSVVDLEKDGWNLVSSSPGSFRVESSCFEFDTSFANNGKTSFNIFSGSVSVAKIEKNNFFNIVDYSMSYQDNILSITKISGSEEYINSALIDLSGKNISDMVSILRNINISSLTDNNIPFGVFYEIFLVEKYSGIPCSRIASFNDSIFDFIDILISDFEDSFDPYAANAYSSINNSYSYLSQNFAGDQWDTLASNKIGYTFKFDVQSLLAEDGLSPNRLNHDGSFGVYLNDGSYKLKIDTLPDSLIVNGIKSSNIDLSSNFSSFHVAIKDGKYRLFNKNDGGWVAIDEGDMESVNVSGIEKDNISCSARSGKKVIFWEESNSDGKLIKFIIKAPGGSWSSPAIAVGTDYYASKPSSCIDSFGNVHLVFEIYANSKSDIGYSVYKNGKWSTPVKIVDQSGSSIGPKILVDEYNNMYVSWIDKKFGKSDIFFCQYNFSQSRWLSSGFSGFDSQVSSSEVEVSNIDHAYKAGNYFVVWSEKNIFGRKKIKLARYNSGSKSWNSAYSGGTDFDVSNIDSKQADFPSICIDFDNNVHIVWQDILNGFNRIYYRQISPGLSSLTIPKIITSVSYNFDCVRPYLSLIDDITDPYTSKNGDLVLNFYKPRNYSVDPYNQEINSSSIENSIQEIYTARWSREYRNWLSSGSKVGEEGGYDTRIVLPETRYVNLFTSPKSIEDIQDIFYLGIDSNIENSSIYLYNIKYDLSFYSGAYSVGIDSYSGFDPDEILVADLNRKSLIFGSSSNSISGKLRFKNIKFSFSESRDPFYIDLIGPTTYNLPDINYVYARPNNYGDVWTKTLKNIIFVSARKNLVFDSSDIKNDNITHFVSSSGFTESDNINCLKFDSFGNMIVSVKQKLLFSSDHFRFFVLNVTGEGSSVLSKNFDYILEFNDNLVLIDDSNIIIIKNYKNSIIQKIPFIDPYESDNVFSINLTLGENLEIVIYPLSSISASINKIYSASSDQNYLWICTNVGVYQIDSKLNSNSYVQQFSDELNFSYPAISVECVDDNLRFFATSNKIFLSSGSSIKSVDTIARYVGIQGSDKDFLQDAELFNINDIKSVKYIDSKNLLIVSSNYIYRLIFKDIYSYQTEYIQIFDRSNINIVFDTNVEQVQNSQSLSQPRQKFVFPPVQDDGEGKYYVEVYLNKKRITRGYRISTKYGIIYFEDKILPNDEVYIKVRKDIRLYNDYSQNRAEIEAFGTKTFSVENLITQNNSIYSVISDGVADAITTRNEIIKLPYDEVTIDKEPPIAKLRYVEQVGPNTIKLQFIKIDDSDGNLVDYDKVSGVSGMVISNYDNFTSDGTSNKPFVPFQEEFLFDVDLGSSSGSVSANLPQGVIGRCGNYFTRTTDGKVVTLIGTSNLARIYYLNSNNEFEENFVSLDEEAGSRVEFIYRFNNGLIVGVSKANGFAKIFMSTNGASFSPVATLDSNGVSHPHYNSNTRKLYFGTYRISSSESTGSLYSFDGNNLERSISNIDNGIMSVTGFENFVIFGTKQPNSADSRIFKVPVAPTVGNPTIIHNAETSVVSITSIGTSIYAGLQGRGKIIRSLNTGVPFITSFQTLRNLDVNRMATLQFNNTNRIFAAVDKGLYVFQGTWNLKGSSSHKIMDIFKDVNGNIVYVTEGDVRKIIQNVQNEVRIFAKLIDNAGNQTDINGDPDTSPEDGYNDNLFVKITPETENFNFDSFSISNKIIEIDGANGQKLRVIDGDATFYSADKIMVEVGIYETEIFNNTSGHITWGSISWDVIEPPNTSVYFEVRSGVSRNSILASDYTVVLSSSSNNYDLSFMEGQYLQVRIVLRSASQDNLAPSVRSLRVVSLGSSSSEVFTVNFSLPSKIKRGILTSQKELPFGSSILFGINTTDDTSFSSYQIIPENRIFSTDESQFGSNLRIGVRLLTSQIVGQIANPIPDNDPYSSAIFANSIIWSYLNEDPISVSVDFRVEVYEDPAQSNLLFSVSTISSPNYFKVDGENFPVGSSSIVRTGQTRYFSFIPYGLPLTCDENYYCKIYMISQNDSEPTEIESNILLRKQCGTNFFNMVTFDFVNELDFANFHFRVRFFADEARNNLLYSLFSQVDTNGWSYNGSSFPQDGVPLQAGEIATIGVTPNFEQFEFEVNKRYFLSIDANDGEKFSWNNNSYVYQVSQTGTGPSCGIYENVPVLRSFAMMFELENGELIKLRLDN